MQNLPVHVELALHIGSALVLLFALALVAGVAVATVQAVLVRLAWRAAERRLHAVRAIGANLAAAHGRRLARERSTLERDEAAARERARQVMLEYDEHQRARRAAQSAEERAKQEAADAEELERLESIQRGKEAANARREP